MTGDLAGIVLAAGEGRRLRPLTLLRPKPLCPVGDSTLLEHALRRVSAVTGWGADHLAVNAHHLAEQIEAAVGDRARVSLEAELLGTAGALGLLRDWIAGRDVLLTNADTLLLNADLADLDLAELLPARRGTQSRLLVAAPGAGQRPDFTVGGTASGTAGTAWRYLGAALLPWEAVRQLRPEPSGLYEVLWRDAHQHGQLDFVPLPTGATAVDCGTPADYLGANLLLNHGASVIGAGATVLGKVERSVVWDGAHVAKDEWLTDAVRAGDQDHPLTLRDVTVTKCE